MVVSRRQNLNLPFTTQTYLHLQLARNRIFFLITAELMSKYYQLIGHSLILASLPAREKEKYVFYKLWQNVKLICQQIVGLYHFRYVWM